MGECIDALLMFDSFFLNNFDRALSVLKKARFHLHAIPLWKHVSKFTTVRRSKADVQGDEEENKHREI